MTLSEEIDILEKELKKFDEAIEKLKADRRVIRIKHDELIKKKQHKKIRGVKFVPVNFQIPTKELDGYF